MAMAAMKVVSAEGFSGMGYPKKNFPQGVAGPLFEKTPVFGVRLPKLDQFTVLSEVRSGGRLGDMIRTALNYCENERADPRFCSSQTRYSVFTISCTSR
jgi:hypothetical protein